MEMNQGSMRDLPAEEDKPLNKYDAYARSISKPGNVNPANPNHARFIEQVKGAVESGLISEAGIENVAKFNPSLAPMLYTSYNKYKSSASAQKEVEGIVGQHFNPAVPAKPEVPFETNEEQAFGMPGLRGNVSQEARAAIPAKADYAGAVNALAPKYPDLAEKYQKLGGLDKKSSDGMAYGGIQTGSDPKTKKPIQYIVGKDDFQAREVGTGRILKPGIDYEPTVSMGFQTVMGPGGIPMIVQMPTRGVPGQQPTVTPSGQMPDKNFTPETAGKLRMIDQGMADVVRARDLVFDEKGKLKKGVLFGAKIPGTAGVGEESRMLFSAVENAVSAKYRAETGAAGNAEEVKSIARRFTPTVLDSEKSASDKLDRLEEYLSSTYDLVDPSGTYPRVSKRPDARRVKPESKAPKDRGVSKEDIMKEIQKRRAEGRM